jgi:hypothetical protein
MRTHLLVWSLVLVCLTTVALPSGSFAAKPDVTREHIEGDPEPIAECASFTVLIQSSYDLTTRRFFDRKGTLTKWSIR